MDTHILKKTHTTTVLKVLTILLGILLPKLAYPWGGASPAEKLRDIHDKIKERYPHTQHISAEQLALLPDQQLALFDVRTEQEYAVSHLDTAIRVSPEVSAKDFVNRYADQIQGKTVVLYCSVGERSSKLAEALHGVSNLQIYNLEGGIFNWHNSEGKLVDSEGSTAFVHPYNWFWGRLLERKDYIRKKN